MTYKAFLRQIGDNIKLIREKELGLTVNRAAQIALMRWTQLRDIENGLANPNMKTLYKIAKAFNVPIDRLFEIKKSQLDFLEPTIEDIKRAGRRLSN